MEVNSEHEIDSDKEIKSLLLKILKKLSNKSNNKVKATHEEINTKTYSENDSKSNPPMKEEEATAACTVEQYLCDTCDIIFSESNKYLSHYLQYHGQKVDEMTYDCAKCYKSFSQHQLFMEHVKIILEKEILYDEKPTSSNDESFSKETKLMKNTETVHEVPKVHKCVICERTFSQARNVKKHIHTVHKGHKDHKCESCGK